MTKAQLAVETLLIYGIAILIVMLAIGALIGFGVLDLGGILPDTCSVQGAPLTCEEYFLSKSTGINMEFSNNLGKNIQNMTLIRVTPSSDNDKGLIPSLAGTCIPGPELPVVANFTVGGLPVSESNILINGERASVKGTPTCLPVAALKAGKKIGMNFEIQYQASGSSLARKASGKMRVTVVE